MIRDCVFENSTTNGIEGNAIYFEVPENQECTIQSCQFINCGTTGYAIKSSSKRLILDRITVTFPSTNKSNVIIFTKKGEFQILNSIFINAINSLTFEIKTDSNDELTIESSNCTFQGNTSSFYFKPHNWVISNSIFSDITCTNNWMFYFDDSISNTMKFENCNFTRCSSKTNSNRNGLIILPKYQSNEINNCIFNLSCSTSNKESLCIITFTELNDVIITNNQFIDCGMNQFTAFAQYYKSKVLRYDSNIINFTDMSSKKRPGLALLDPKVITISNSQFINTNLVNAIDMKNKLEGDFEIFNCIFDNNCGTSNQCFYLNNIINSFVFQNIIFKNQVTSNPIGFISFKTLGNEQIFENFSFISNIRNADVNTFTTNNISLLKFMNCNWLNNNAPNIECGGGAILFGSLLSPLNEEIYLSKCHFFDNSAYSYGGSIGCFTNKPFTMIDCTFFNNKATNGNGGAVSCSTEYNISFHNCTFYSNYASSSGGAIHIDPQENSMTGLCSILNCHFESNSAEGNGQAIFLEKRAQGTNYLIGEGTIFKDNFKDDTQETNGIIASKDSKIDFIDVTFLFDDSTKKNNSTNYLHRN